MLITSVCELTGNHRITLEITTQNRNKNWSEK
jgi:hypothetical protein